MEEKKNKLKEHEFCLRCGRRLRNPVARERGYGAVCERKLRISNVAPLFIKNDKGVSDNG